MAEPGSGGLLEIRGSIEHIIFANEENGYCVCDLGTEDGDDLITVQGILPYVSEGDQVILWGKWIQSPKYGRQFAVERYERSLPADVNAIYRYLSSRAVKGIGPKTAQRIVDTFGEDTFDVIENHPTWLTQIQGISEKKAREISQDFKDKSGIRSAMLFFRAFFGAALTMRIYKKWGASAVDRAKENPYALCDEIPGIGFEKADTLAQSIGYDPNSDARLCSGIVYLLRSNAIQNGHVCLPKGKLLAAAESLLGGTAEQRENALDVLCMAGRICALERDGETFLYEKRAYEAETYIASKLKLLDRLCTTVSGGNVQAFIDKEEKRCGIQYAAQQRQAIFHCLQSGVMVLTGGPGTGKTTVVRALLDIFESMDFLVALAAPTGRAAKRLSESTSHEASTIHRLLEMEYEDTGGEDGGETHFRRNAENLLDEDVIIIDEASMVGNGLMYSLLKAVKPGARMIIIGDADQLPSVEAGNVLHDIIESRRFSTVCLTEIFRQAQKSLIITNAHAINRGEMPQLDVKDNDFFFLPRATDRETVYTIADLCKNRLPHAYGAMAREGVQVISPSRKGEAGTEHMNAVMQDWLNPADGSKREYVFREKVFREGDRIMQVRNNYELNWEKPDGSTGMGIYNGDIGVITDINPASEYMEIRFDDRHVAYDFSLLDDLEHAWAVTVHKSQGCEYPIVIIPLYDAPRLLLTRHLFYTAVTRAQSMVILVGKAEIAGIMVANQRQALRYTGLAARLADGEGAGKQ